MKRENDEIADLFRSRLEFAEMPVRDGFWEVLEQEIPAMINRRKRIMYRFAAAASVLLILAGASAAFWFLSPKEEIANAFTQVTIQTPSQATVGEDVIKPQYAPLSQAASPVVLKKAPASQVIPNLALEEEEELISVSFSMSFSFSSTIEGDVAEDHSGQQGQVSYAGGVEDQGTSSPRTKEKTLATSAQPDKSRGWAVGAWASTGLRAKEEYIRHKMPFSVGVSLQKRFSDKVALESGLAYTQLKSNISHEGVCETRKLHYVGIPLKVNISLYEAAKTSLYTSAGGMIEKCVSGPTEAFQTSLSAGVGIQHKVNNHLSVYAEPGIAYYFDNGSSVATLRKEKPLNLNLLCGVRMTY